MEQRIRDRFSESILNQARGAFGINPGDLQELDGFESFIYKFNRSDDKGILRISHSIRRTSDQIRGELDYINYLKAGGAGVAGALISDHGNWVEEIKDGSGEYFLANAFEMALGEHHRGEWSDRILFEYGRQIGLMHKLSLTYEPAVPAWRRPDWDDPIHLEVEQFIPEKDHKIKQMYQDVIEKTRSFPVERTVYGLIHQDAHRGNFFIDNQGRITFFDFDDSSYSWFVEDIALVLFYAVMGQQDPAGFTAMFLEGFLPGYYSEFDLDPVWFQEIPIFLKRREIDLYAVIHRSFDVENLDDPWCKWYLDGRKDNLENEIPYLDFDFTSLDQTKYR